VTGNTHRAEICIDKLFDWRTPHGRQGLLELRAFEMPPHPRLMVAQTQLVRALIAALSQEPYRAPLVRWGQELHDRFLLPTWIWRDLEEVLEFLSSRGFPIPPRRIARFSSCAARWPDSSRLATCSWRSATPSSPGTCSARSRQPGAPRASSIRPSNAWRSAARAWFPNGIRSWSTVYVLPLRPTGRTGEAAAGVRFRAWAPPHSLHPHLGIHHPLRFDVVDLWMRRSLGACAYHVWHPEGRGYDTPPLTRFEAAARRAQRFTVKGR